MAKEQVETAEAVGRIEAKKLKVRNEAYAHTRVLLVQLHGELTTRLAIIEELQKTLEPKVISVSMNRIEAQVRASSLLDKIVIAANKWDAAREAIMGSASQS